MVITVLKAVILCIKIVAVPGVITAELTRIVGLLCAGSKAEFRLSLFISATREVGKLIMPGFI